MEVSDQFHVPSVLPRAKQVSMQLEGWVDPRVSLGDTDKLKNAKYFLAPVRYHAWNSLAFSIYSLISQSIDSLPTAQ
jgi:hypothetical protein